MSQLSHPNHLRPPNAPRLGDAPALQRKDLTVAKPPARNQKKSEKKSLPGPPAPGPKNSGKCLEKVPNGHFRDIFKTFRTFLRLFFQTFWGGPRAGGPRRLFSDPFLDFERLLWLPEGLATLLQGTVAELMSGDGTAGRCAGPKWPTMVKTVNS